MELHQGVGECPKKLIEAAVGAVDGDTPAPPELRLSWQCEKYGALPDAGGVLDQDHRLLILMTSLSNVYNALSHYRNSAGAAIHNLSEGERKILRFLLDEGLL